MSKNTILGICVVAVVFVIGLAISGNPFRFVDESNLVRNPDRIDIRVIPQNREVSFVGYDFHDGDRKEGQLTFKIVNNSNASFTGTLIINFVRFGKGNYTNYWSSDDVIPYWINNIDINPNSSQIVSFEIEESWFPSEYVYKSCELRIAPYGDYASNSVAPWRENVIKTISCH